MPAIAAIQRVETENLIGSVNRLVQEMSADNKTITRSSDGGRENNHLGGTRRNGNRYREQCSKDRARSPTPIPNTCERNDNSKEDNICCKCRLCMPKCHWAKNCHNCFTCGNSTHMMPLE